MRRVLAFAGVALLMTAVVAGAFLGYQNKQGAAATPPAKPVTVPVSRGDVVHTVTAPGQLIALRDSMVATGGDGRLIELAVRPGSAVRAGEVIARLDPAPDETAPETDQIQLAPAETTITAPFDGVVLDTFARPGEYLPAGANLALLTDPTLGEVRTTVIEEDLSLVTVGQTADVYFDARPDLVVGATVARIVPRRVQGEARPLYHVYLSLDEPLPGGVYPGMTADASLLIASAAGVLRLPRALVAARSDGTATVEVWEDGRIAPHDVTTGLRGDVYIAILDGLNEGDEVVGE